MTVNYVGLGDYKIYLDNKTIVLHEKEISDIISHFTDAREDNIVVPNNAKMELDEESYQKEVYELQELLRESNEEVEKLENMLL